MKLEKFMTLLLIVLSFTLIAMLIRFYYTFEIIIIPKESVFKDAEYNTNITEYKEKINFDCHKTDDYNYCVFPNFDLRLFYPTGQSMFPTFNGESEILLCNNNFTLEENGIYAYEYFESDFPVVHRCISLTPTGCIFKGDNNSCSENVTSDEILCRIEWLVRETK